MNKILRIMMRFAAIASFTLPVMSINANPAATSSQAWEVRSLPDELVETGNTGIACNMAADSLGSLHLAILKGDKANSTNELNYTTINKDGTYGDVENV